MKFVEFCNEVEEFARKELGDDVKVELICFTDINDTQKPFLKVEKGSAKVLLALEQPYELMKMGYTLDVIMGSFSVKFNEACALGANGKVRESIEKTKEMVLSNVVPVLINYEKSKDFLSDKVYRRFGEFAICYRPSHVCGEGEFIISTSYLSELKVTEEDIYKKSMDNLLNKTEFETIWIGDTMKEYAMECMKADSEQSNEFSDEELSAMIDKQLREADITKEQTPMYIVSNKKRQFGASVLLNMDYLEQVSEEIGNDLVIILSSIHEVIVLNAGDERFETQDGFNDLMETVSYVNASGSISNNMVLSDNLYFYKKGSREVKLFELTSEQAAV